MIEEPPYSQTRSRIHDQKIPPSPRIANNNNAKSKQFKSSENNIRNNNSIDLEFIEQIDLENFSSLLLNNDKDLNDEEYYEININKGKDKMKKIIQKFIRMKVFPIDSPQLINKLLKILQIIFRSLSNTIFQEKDSKNTADKNSKTQNLSDVKMVVGIQCPICQKLFRSSYFIDMHIHKKHPKYEVLWQSFKAPVPFYDQKQPVNDNFSKKSEEIEKALKKIHKDLKKRNSSVSIESRISNVESTMKNLGLLSKQISLPNQERRAPHHSRRHSSNSINIVPFQNTKNEAQDYDEYDINDKDNNSHKEKSYHYHHSEHISNVIEYDQPKLNSARVHQSTPPPQVGNTDKTPNSARTNSIHQSQSAKIPKIANKPFIPNLHLQTLKSQPEFPKQGQEKQLKENIIMSSENNETNDIEINASVPAEARRTPNSSRPGGMRRPIPRKKPSSINVPSIQIDVNQKSCKPNYYSPRLPSDTDDLAFANSYHAPQSARGYSNSNFNNLSNNANEEQQNSSKPQKKAPESSPHSKRVIPLPSSLPNNCKLPPSPLKSSVNKSKLMSPPVSPFAFIQTHSDDDDDESDEIHITTTKLPQKNEQIENQQESKNSNLANSQESKENSNIQKIESSKENSTAKKNDNESDSENLIIPKPTSVSKRTIDEDEVPEEYFDSISSVSSESSVMPEIDFKPKPKSNSQEKNEGIEQPERRRKRKKKIVTNNK